MAPTPTPVPTPTPSLLGPPAIHRPTPTVTSVMNQVVSKLNSTTLTETLPMGYTQHRSPTFLSTGDPCLDFFFHVVPNTPAASLKQRLQLAWEHDPLKALKLICNLRSVRGTGKSDKEGYYTAALWLFKHHPRTLACNVRPLAEFGYFRDLPEILLRVLEGPDVRHNLKQERLNQIAEKQMKSYRGRRSYNFYRHRQIEKPKRRSKKKEVSKEAKIVEKLQRVELKKQEVRDNREEKRITKAKKVVERYGADPDFRFLHERVSDLFSDLLKSDLKLLKEGELKNISLAAKWCPSIDSSFDKSTLLCESIAKKVFDRNSYPEYEGVEEAHYAYRVRDRLRKDVLVPLRKALELPQAYIGTNDWGSIQYDRVSSVAMKLYKDKFLKHDQSRFMEYLENVKSGKTTIAAGALLPHEIIASLYADDGGSDGGEVAELQWKRMVDDLASKGKMKNCLAICDVSRRSMNGTPMEVKVSVALGVLVSELSEEPWKGKLITFSENPTLQLVIGDDLRSKVDFVKKMELGNKINFQKVFDLILEVAVNGNLREDQMIKRVFVFSNMEFEKASKKDETDYEAIVRKFQVKGYGSSVPEIVFWNLKDSESTPVQARQQGVALVSGFSKNVLSFFLEDNGKLSPESVMEAAIAGDEYKKLVVID